VEIDRDQLPGTPRAQRQGEAIRELMVSQQLFATQLSRALRPLGVSLTQISLLSHLATAETGAAVAEIADAMEVNQPAVSKTLKSLVALGAVIIAIDSADLRRRIALLTPAGHETLHAAQIAMHPVSNKAFANISDQQLLEFTSALRCTSLSIAPTRV
jgi:DNA-binding MarR family transcriptional regulator